MNKLTIYLAGSIRDGVDYDIYWRERVINDLSEVAKFINPLGGKKYNASTKHWTVSGIPSTSRLIVKHDFWAVDRADIVLFNFAALSDKYPNIGTLVEFGRATGTGALIYSIIEKGYKGHENANMFDLHPFLAENSAVVFDTLDDCVYFLLNHIPVLTGDHPHFKR